MRHPRSDSEATSNRVPSEESVPLYLKRVFFGTILPAKASVPFICAIRKIRGSISLRSEQPLAVTQAVWSAAGGRACTGCLSSGNAETHFVKKRVRCSRGCLPAEGGLPRTFGLHSAKFPTRSRFPSSLPARPSLNNASVAAGPRWAIRGEKPAAFGTAFGHRPRAVIRGRQPRLHQSPASRRGIRFERSRAENPWPTARGD